MTNNQYQPKCGDALRLGTKSRYGSFRLWINVWVAGKTVWSVVNTCHTLALWRWVAHDKALYKSMVTLLTLTWSERERICCSVRDASWTNIWWTLSTSTRWSWCRRWCARRQRSLAPSPASTVASRRCRSALIGWSSCTRRRCTGASSRGRPSTGMPRPATSRPSAVHSSPLEGTDIASVCASIRSDATRVSRLQSIIRSENEESLFSPYSLGYSSVIWSFYRATQL